MHIINDPIATEIVLISFFHFTPAHVNTWDLKQKHMNNGGLISLLSNHRVLCKHFG